MIQPHKGRASSAAPSLSAERRFRLDGESVAADRAEAAVMESLEKQEAAVSADGDSDTTDLLKQMGRPMSAAEVTQRLKKMNHNFLFEPSKADPSKLGIYILENRPDPVTGCGSIYKRFVCGMESGYAPEFSVRHCEVEKVPDPHIAGQWNEIKKFTRETRGWRTVLARLIREKLISPGQAEIYFQIPGGRDSRNWQVLTT